MGHVPFQGPFRWLLHGPFRGYRQGIAGGCGGLSLAPFRAKKQGGEGGSFGPILSWNGMPTTHLLSPVLLACCVVELNLTKLDRVGIPKESHGYDHCFVLQTYVLEGMSHHLAPICVHLCGVNH